MVAIRHGSAERGPRLRLGSSASMLLAVVMAACGQRQGAEGAADLQRASLGVPATAALVVGCWVLTWNPQAGAPSSATDALPDSIRFRDEVVFGTRERLLAPATHPEGRVAAPGAEPTWESRYVLNRWWIDGQSLRVRLWDGEAEEWRATFTVAAAELVGTARYESSGVQTNAGVRAAGIPCQY